SPSPMARGDVRIAVTLACETCKRRNYQANKSKRNTPDRLELRKYCKGCGRHTPHRETRYAHMARNRRRAKERQAERRAARQAARENSGSAPTAGGAVPGAPRNLDAP